MEITESIGSSIILCVGFPMTPRIQVDSCHFWKDPPKSNVVNCLVAVSYVSHGEFVFRYVALYMTPSQLFFSCDTVESSL